MKIQFTILQNPELVNQTLSQIESEVFTETHDGDTDVSVTNASCRDMLVLKRAASQHPTNIVGISYHYGKNNGPIVQRG